MSRSRRRLMIPVAIVLIAGALAAGNLLFLAHALRESTPGRPPTFLARELSRAYDQHPQTVGYLAFAPLVAGIIVALLMRVRGAQAEAARGAAAAQPAPAPPFASALQLLGLLQQEGRLIDFLEEDIDAYSDAQVGAAVRSIHAGCRKALHDRMHIERIYTQDDGATIEVPAGFAPGTVRLTGNVRGQPPFRGTLQHGGWRASRVVLPDPPPGHDPAILAPAEVEIP